MPASFKFWPSQRTRFPFYSAHNGSSHQGSERIKLYWKGKKNKWCKDKRVEIQIFEYMKYSYKGDSILTNKNFVILINTSIKLKKNSVHPTYEILSVWIGDVVAISRLKLRKLFLHDLICGQVVETWDLKGRLPGNDINRDKTEVQSLPASPTITRERKRNRDINPTRRTVPFTVFRTYSFQTRSLLEVGTDEVVGTADNLRLDFNDLNTTLYYWNSKFCEFLDINF